MPGGVKFSDGVIYSNAELKILKKNPPDDYKYLHQIKKMFFGTVIEI